MIIANDRRLSQVGSAIDVTEEYVSGFETILLLQFLTNIGNVPNAVSINRSVADRLDPRDRVSFRLPILSLACSITHRLNNVAEYSK
jgi:hypothetical protein